MKECAPRPGTPEHRNKPCENFLIREAVVNPKQARYVRYPFQGTVSLTAFNLEETTKQNLYP